jgi:hypothetical protein
MTGAGPSRDGPVTGTGRTIETGPVSAQHLPGPARAATQRRYPSSRARQAS